MPRAAIMQNALQYIGSSHAYCLTSTKIASTSSSASSACVTGGRISASLVFNSVILVLPSGIVYLTLPPLSTYTTATGWECIGVLSPLEGAYRNTRTFWSSASTVKCFTPYFIASCPKTVGQEISRNDKLSPVTFFIFKIPLDGWRTYATRRVIPRH